MSARRIHRVIGLIMLLPFLGWAVTGAVFFIKPGYGGAYDALPVRAYPLGLVATGAADPGWLEVRQFRTVLGTHLLARTAGGWQQVDPVTGTVLAPPDESDVRRLLNDAFAANPDRYGQVAHVNGETATTDTGVVVTLDWNRMALSQRGPDTDRIDALYRVHYLQWTGIAAVDRVLGLAGLVLLVVLGALGLRLFFGRSVGRAS